MERAAEATLAMAWSSAAERSRLERASLAIQEGHWELDLVARTHWASSNYYALLGYKRDETSFDTFEKVSSIVHPDDRATVTATARRHMADPGVPYEVELRVAMKDGGYRWFRLSGSAERDASGKPVRLLGSIQDIQKQKIAEDALREVQSRFERAIHGTQDGLWEADVASGVMWLSPRMQALLGFAEGELGDHVDVLRERVHPEDLAVADAALKECLDQKLPIDREMRLRTKEGAYRWFRLRATPGLAPDGAVQRMSGSIQDVTSECESRDELIKVSEAAQAANRSKSAFLANVSHEIRTPMNGIIGMTSLLLDTALDETQRECASTIRDSACSLLSIINDILDFSRIEAGRMQIERASMDLHATVSDVVTMMAFQAEAKRLTLVKRIAPDVPRRVLGDAQRLRQCLTNLLGNAIKFTAEGEVTLEVTVERGEGESGSVRFEVRDTGIGISSDAATGLFEPFVQADSSTTRDFGGTGLGLSIVKRLVELMAGEVGVRSELGQGSTFWFALPLERDRSCDTSSPAAPRPSPPSTAFAGRVLLVEDNLVNQKVGQRFLERLGCEVTVVANGQEAIDACRADIFRLVLMDVQMPVMDGYTATRRIREMEGTARRTPIVALTANAMASQVQQCFEAGMDGVMTKPLEAERLEDTLRQFGLAI